MFKNKAALIRKTKFRKSPNSIYYTVMVTDQDTDLTFLSSLFPPKGSCLKEILSKKKTTFFFGTNGLLLQCETLAFLFNYSLS